MTLLNVWRYVLDYPPTGTTIVYDAKERVKKEKTFWQRKLDAAVAEVGGVLIESDKQACVVVTYDPVKYSTMEDAYTDFVLKFALYSWKFKIDEKLYAQIVSDLEARNGAVNGETEAPASESHNEVKHITIE